MISVPKLCSNRLEYVANLSKAILLAVVVQVYGFHRKSEKLKMKKLWITANKKVTKKIV